MDDDIKVKIALLEHRVNNMEMKIDAINNKLEQLLELKSKGMGAFWLASLVVGSSLFGLFITFVKLLKG